jgi:hypothetical protein
VRSKGSLARIRNAGYTCHRNNCVIEIFNQQMSGRMDDRPICGSVGFCKNALNNND